MPEVTVAFIDVGQGDSTAIILPDKMSTIVIDCPSNAATSEYFDKNNISGIDFAFLTHSDLDHIGGISDLLTNFAHHNTKLAYNHDSFKTLYSDNQEKKRRLILRQLSKLVDLHGITTLSPRTGDSWKIQDLLIETLHPDDRDIKQLALSDDKNNASIVLRLTFAGKKVLLTGDIEGQGWKWIIDRSPDLQSDVLKFPHHGAWYNPKGDQPLLNDILRQISPDFTIISVGTKNQYGHPTMETFDQLRKLSYRCRLVCTQATEKCDSKIKNQNSPHAVPCAGTIEVVINNKGQIEVNPEIKKHQKVIKDFDNPQCKIPKHEQQPNRIIRFKKL